MIMSFSDPFALFEASTLLGCSLGACGVDRVTDVAQVFGSRIISRATLAYAGW